ncbi:hypothetical protein [Altererythrobacter aquiaggeris]
MPDNQVSRRRSAPGTAATAGLAFARSQIFTTCKTRDTHGTDHD